MHAGMTPAMSKTRQRQRKKQRQAELRAGIDRRAFVPRAGWTPEECAEEDRLIAIENAKLVEMFGEKASYSDEEIEAMIDALETEGALPKED